MIKVTNLKVSYGTKPVINSLSLKINSGAHIAILGPNGAGKSTLLKCLGGIIGVERNTVFLNEQDITTLTQKKIARTIAYVPQHLDFLVPCTVREFIELGCYPWSGFFDDHSSAVKQALALTHTTKLQDRLLTTLSGGERRRITIAAALAQDPKVLLLDEPMTFLDPYHHRAVSEVLCNLRNETSITTVTVTHDVTLGVAGVDYLYGMKAGELSAEGSPEDFLTTDILYDLYNIPFTFLKHPQFSSPIAIPEEGL